MISNKKRLQTALLVVAALISIFCTARAQSQTITLSPEQQRLLNQLPASQRDAAMRQLQQISQQKNLQSPAARESIPAAESTGEEADDAELLPVAPALFAPGSTAIVMAIRLETEEDEDTTERLDPEYIIGSLHQRNPYTLDKDGRLTLPGINPIDLAGLNEEQAALRVSADPALRGIMVSVVLLPLADVGLDALEPYGYELFEERDETASDSYGVPVPADYVTGPGDSLRIQLFGNRNAEYELVVERDGSIRFPEIGPLQVGGMSFGEVRELIKTRVGEQLIGTQASVSMGELRLVQVFLVGDVNAPGAYTVGSLSTMTTVLSVGGGVARNGSLRRIELKRNGRVVSTLDVYDLLLRGNTSDDARIQSGDVVFVPPVGTRITVAGEVRRPGIYEYRGAANVSDIIKLAGGLLPSALAGEVSVERIDPNLGLRVIDAGYSASRGSTLKVQDGDTLRVPAGVADYDASISLVGNVQRPGAYQWRPGMRLSGLIPNSRYLKAGSDLHYVLIRREPQPNAGPHMVSADLAAAWEMQGTVVDLELQPRDTVYVFDLRTGREQFINPLIDELKLRASVNEPLPIVNVGGSVNAPGEFPLEPGMRIADLARAGGGLSQSAYTDQAELTRYTIAPDGRRTTLVITIDLGQALAGDAFANMPLQPFDFLNIKETPNWRENEYIEVVGEVEFPGRYPIRQNETLASVIARAGGLTDFAFVDGSVFTRETLRQREREQINVLADRLESDLATLVLTDPSQTESYDVGQSMLKRLRSSKPVGRLVIDLNKVLEDGAKDSLILRDGDAIYIPQMQQDVTVLGEVQYSTSHHYSPNMSRDDYLGMSGGTTNKADAKRIYIVRANGEVVANQKSRFFFRSAGARIEPGDTIVVPLDTDRVRPLTLWTSVSQIVYNVAIAATAVSRF